MKICHIITGLEDGGAEAVLYRLCKNDLKNQHSVISLSGTGKYGKLLESINVPVTSLNMSPGLPSLIIFFKLIKLLKNKKNNIIQTWMNDANLFGGLAAYIAGYKKIIWSIHQSRLEYSLVKKRNIWITKFLALISTWIPAKIIFCAKESVIIHKKLGFDRNKICLIHNGYDTSDFKPKKIKKKIFQKNLQFPLSTPLIGTVSRFDKIKDITNLLDALRIINNKKIHFKSILVGKGLIKDNKQLFKLIKSRGLSSIVKPLGLQKNIPYIMNTINLHVLPSAGEAFPNVLAEAMLCGTPCVATNVGDCALIIGKTGWVVPRKNSLKLANSIEKALIEMKTKNWKQRCTDARSRIVNNFAINKMLRFYEKLWQEVNQKL